MPIQHVFLKPCLEIMKKEIV